MQTKKKIYKWGVQRGVFLNRYDLFYACRDTVNQVGKISPGLTKNVESEISNITQQQINQVISQGGNKIERVLPKILRGACKDIYQTPFRLLG